jgi:hypothetical protein
MIATTIVFTDSAIPAYIDQLARSPAEEPEPGLEIDGHRAHGLTGIGIPASEHDDRTRVPCP